MQDRGYASSVATPRESFTITQRAESLRGAIDVAQRAARAVARSLGVQTGLPKIPEGAEISTSKPAPLPDLRFILDACYTELGNLNEVLARLEQDLGEPGQGPR